MSYSLGAVPKRAIEVGQKAATDPILARASLDASLAMIALVGKRGAARVARIRRLVRVYGPGSEQSFNTKLRQLMAGGARDPQATYDAFRLVAANWYASMGMQWLAAQLGPEALGEEDVGKAVGCGIGAGATAIVAAFAGAYTAGIAAPIVGAGGTMAMTAAGCGAGASNPQQAAQQATEAQRLAEEAAARDAAAAREAADRKKTITTVALVGVGGLVLLGAGYAIVTA